MHCMSRVNPVYRSLLDKSVGSMLSAIEIYNKPDFQYREETFAILAVNSWELLMKAFILRQNHFAVNSIYEKEYPKCKNGDKSKRAVVKKNRCGNPQSISIFAAIEILAKEKKITSNLRANVESLIELRDNAVHFVNTLSISKQIQELGFACIKNYMQIIKEWNMEIDLSRYNFYLMPLAYIDGKVFADSSMSKEVSNYIQLVQKRLKEKDADDTNFDIAVSIKLDFKRGNSFDSLPVKYDSENGIPVSLSDAEWKERYPLTYKKLVDLAKNRYENFKQGTFFNEVMRSIKQNKKLTYVRKLNPDSANSQQTFFYSSNVLFELDKSFIKKTKK